MTSEKGSGDEPPKHEGRSSVESLTSTCMIATECTTATLGMNGAIRPDRVVRQNPAEVSAALRTQRSTPPSRSRHLSNAMKDGSRAEERLDSVHVLRVSPER